MIEPVTAVVPDESTVVEVPPEIIALPSAVAVTSVPLILYSFESVVENKV